MNFKNLIICLILILLTANSTGAADRLKLEHSDRFEVVNKTDHYVTYVTGNVHFITKTGDIYCDSARWVKGKDVQLNGRVHIDDTRYNLKSDSAFYNISSGEFLALGQHVTLWSYKDSLFAVGTHAFYSEDDSSFYMENRPTMYINYPDTIAMYEVVGDRIDYNSSSKSAEALGNVNISSNEFSSQSGCAKMNGDGSQLDLFDKPSMTHKESVISGELISIFIEKNLVDYIDVLDSAQGNFKEPIDSSTVFYDESILKGKRIFIDFVDGDISTILCYGQAYSWYYPSSKGTGQTQENVVSGDTIKFFVNKEELQKIHIIGGSQGTYMSGKDKMVDSVLVQIIDTIDYRSDFIEYNVRDSLIELKKAANVKSGNVVLDAHIIDFDTKKNIIEAFSADVEADTIVNPNLLSTQIQPNIIPVILKDGDDEILGDYLLYSIDTEKGRIIQSKTDYTDGLYYGKKLFREQKEVYYVNEGRYTTCNATEPHFHFKSTTMKMIEGKKLIAKPVVFYIHKIPVVALPFYVFPLEKGRHSGFLPFTFGKFERGERYVRNVGYYWAASDYFDVKGAFDYYEQRRTINMNGRVNFKKIYVLDGFVDGNYTQETRYSSVVAQEFTDPRWTLQGAYNHTFSPTFSLRASGSFQSDPSYYTDYSQNLEERLNRSVKSHVSISKRFENNISLAAQVNHTVNLDTETRIDDLPNMSVSFPTMYPFGSGSKNEQGRLEQKFYHKFSLRYNPSLINYSYRTRALDFIDSTYTFDTLTIDTTMFVDSTLLTDTSYYRTRKRYTKIQHNPSLNLPSVQFGNYLNLVPSVSYSETWFKLYETDQSLNAGLDAGETYRTYSYRAGISANTKLYGTIYPRIFGIEGIRHVLTPTVGYSYTPDIQRHPDIRAYAGGGASSVKSRSMDFNLNQLFQAKINKGEVEQVVQLLSINSSFNYNFEAKEKPLSDMNTTINATGLPFVSSVSASMRHSFYDPDTDEQHFLSPYLESFSVRTSLNLAGNKFFFDDPVSNAIPVGADSPEELNQSYQAQNAGINANRGWSFSANYSYSESGRRANWSKSSFITFALRFNLTPNTTVSYNQHYNIERNLTISNSINIVRKIHCWTGSIYWVPRGSNRGFGFTLYVTQLPEIKVDNNYDSFTTQSLNR